MSDQTTLLNDHARRGVELFNAGEYYKCHDVFETVWMNKSGAERHYYQGLIQIAVALYKIIDAPNWRGAVSLLETGVDHLEVVDPAGVELDIVRLKVESQALRALLITCGPDRMGEIDPDQFPKLHLF